MPAPILYHLHGIQLPSSIFISQLTGHTFRTDLESLLEGGAAHAFPQFSAVTAAKPAIEFSTTQVHGIAFVAPAGYAAPTGNIDTYWRRKTNAGTYVALATEQHRRLRIASGMLSWSQITAGHRTPATAQCRIDALYDGVNAPVVHAGSLALTGFTPASDQHFAAGPVSINGTTYDGVQSITIESGVAIDRFGGESEKFDTHISVSRLAQRVQIELLEGAAVSGLTWDGTPLTAFKAYLRAYEENAGLYANNIAVHILATCGSGEGTARLISAEGDGRSPVRSIIELVFVSTATDTAPLVLTPSQTITMP